MPSCDVAVIDEAQHEPPAGASRRITLVADGSGPYVTAALLRGCLEAKPDSKPTFVIADSMGAQWQRRMGRLGLLGARNYARSAMASRTRARVVVPFVRSRSRPARPRRRTTRRSARGTPSGPSDPGEPGDHRHLTLVPPAPAIWVYGVWPGE